MKVKVEVEPDVEVNVRVEVELLVLVGLPVPEWRRWYLIAHLLSLIFSLLLLAVMVVRATLKVFGF